MDNVNIHTWLHTDHHIDLCKHYVHSTHLMRLLPLSSVFYFPWWFIPNPKSSDMRDVNAEGAVSKTTLHLLSVTCLGHWFCVSVKVPLCMCSVALWRKISSICACWAIEVKVENQLNFKMNCNGSYRLLIGTLKGARAGWWKVSDYFNATNKKVITAHTVRWYFLLNKKKEAENFEHQLCH